MCSDPACQVSLHSSTIFVVYDEHGTPVKHSFRGFPLSWVPHNPSYCHIAMIHGAFAVIYRQYYPQLLMCSMTFTALICNYDMLISTLLFNNYKLQLVFIETITTVDQLPYCLTTTV